MIGSHVALSAGMMPGQECVTNPVVRIGDRCLIGRGSGIVGHFSIDIGNDVWTGHHVYITDQNHGYEDISIPISQQTQVERAVSIGDGSWLGAGTVVLPGARIGKHVAVGANSVVTGILPDYCVAVGTPARVIKQYSEESGWVASKFFDAKESNLQVAWRLARNHVVVGSECCNLLAQRKSINHGLSECIIDSGAQHLRICVSVGDVGAIVGQP